MFMFYSVSADNLISEVELNKWPYLQGIRIPRIAANVDLLIGTNASKLMEPWEVINSHGDGPYAVRTRGVTIHFNSDSIHITIHG
jgi:hypothetical protein